MFNKLPADSDVNSPHWVLISWEQETPPHPTSCIPSPKQSWHIAGAPQIQLHEYISDKQVWSGPYVLQPRGVTTYYPRPPCTVPCLWEAHWPFQDVWEFREVRVRVGTSACQIFASFPIPSPSCLQCSSCLSQLCPRQRHLFYLISCVSQILLMVQWKRERNHRNKITLN